MKTLITLLLLSSTIHASNETMITVDYDPAIERDSWIGTTGYVVVHKDRPEIDIIISKNGLIDKCKRDSSDRTNESVALRVPKTLGVQKDNYPKLSYWEGGDHPFAGWRSRNLEKLGSVTIESVTESRVEGVFNYEKISPLTPVSVTGRFSLPICRWEETWE